ncbi:MAG: hypothetical protein A2036_02810 [Omnitrophica bacterium GWA2_50_21]|nr:MAG: hypothetical protein A2036_02810 [Omnitrophica bacterium GWA2_50_21]
MKKIVAGVFLVFILLAAAFFASIYFLLQNKDFQSKITAEISKQFQDQVSLGSFETSFFPPISLWVRDVTIKTNSDSIKALIKTPELKLYLKLWPLFMRRIEIGYVHAKRAEGEIEWRTSSEAVLNKVVLSGFDVELRNLSLDQTVSFSARGTFLGPADNLNIEGTFSLRMKDNTPRVDSVQARVDLKDADLAEIFPLFLREPVVTVKRGYFSWSGTAGWGGNRLSVRGTGNLRQLVYALASTPAKESVPSDFDFEIDSESDFINGQFSLGNLVLKSPYGEFLFKGKLGAGPDTAPIDLEISTGDARLDRISELLVPFDKAIPNKFGFSGEMQGNIFIKGAPDNLSIAGSADLTDSLLSYAAYFTKQKGIPLKLQYELTLEKRKNLQGDFNLWLQEMALKGNLRSWNTESGDGEITFLTNKFSLKGWESIFQPLGKYPMEGQAKVLMNAKGVLSSPEELLYGATVTLENVHAVYEELPITKLNAILELTNRRASSGKLDFLAKDAPVHVEYVRNIPPHESLSFKCTAPEWYPREFMGPVKGIAAALNGERGRKSAEQAANFIDKIIAKDEPVRNLTVSGSWMGSLFSIQEISMNVYGGSLRGAGEMESGAQPHYNFGVQVDRLKLGPLVTQLSGRNLVEGEFFLLGNFEGDHYPGIDPLERLRGKGEFKIVGGALNSFDLLGALGRTAKYSGLVPGTAGNTEFSDLQSNFVVQNKKVVTDQLNIVSPRFSALANGYCTLDGVLNYRVNLTLTNLAAQAGENAQNPAGIPLQIYGDFANPKIGLDSSVISDAVGQLLTGKLFKKKEPSPQPAQQPQAEDSASPQAKPRKLLEEAGTALLTELLSGKKSGGN